MGTKVVTATVKFGTKVLKVYNAPASSSKGQTREALEVTSLADTKRCYIPGALIEDDEITLTLVDEGEGMPTVSDTPAALEITATISDGVNTDKTATVKYAKAIVTKVSPPSQDATGDRKATVDVTFRPDGSEAAA